MGFWTVEELHAGLRAAAEGQEGSSDVHRIWHCRKRCGRKHGRWHGASLVMRAMRHARAHVVSWVGRSGRSVWPLVGKVRLDVVRHSSLVALESVTHWTYSR